MDTSNVTKVDITPAPSSKDLSPEVAASLAEQARSGVTRSESAVVPERPAWLPEKFKSPEDMAKAYSELEKKQGAPKAPVTTTEPVTKAGTEALKVPETKGAAEAAVAGAGFKMEDLQAEFAQKGELSAESLAALEKGGISKEMVNAYVEGQKARNTLLTNDLHAVAGGAEKFDEMHRWSATNLSDPEKVALNKVIETGDHEAIKVAFKGVHAKWAEAGQNEPGRQIEGRKVSDSEGGYVHRDEIVKDMNSKEYKTNEVERRRVMEKLRRTAKGVW